MDWRQLTRGRIAWQRLERVMLTLADRYDREQVRVEFLEADNWLSTPAIVDQDFFVKVVSRQNAVVQALLTAGRNVGAVSAGRPGFFERFSSPLEMVEHEREATRQLRSIGVNAPRPIDAFEVNGLGVLVLEYLPEFDSFSSLSTPELRARADALFGVLARMHDHGLVHGDVRGENILLYDDEIYVIDVTQVKDDRVEEGSAYDLACALAMLAPRIGSSEAVSAALEFVPPRTVLAAREFLQFVRMRPDHEFDVTSLRSEIEQGVDLHFEER